MSSWITEQVVEDAAIEYFRDLGYDYVHGADIEPDGKHAERESFAEVLLLGRLEEAIERINPGVPHDVLIEAIRTIQRLDAPSVVTNNEVFHKFLFEGVTVEASGKDGETLNITVNLIDFDDPESNEFLVVNQFTVKESKQARRPDIVVFVNGIPLGVIELQSSAQSNIRRARS